MLSLACSALLKILSALLWFSSEPGLGIFPENQPAVCSRDDGEGVASRDDGEGVASRGCRGGSEAGSSVDRFSFIYF